MTVEQLRVMREAQPFRPFRVRMADGRSFEVPHGDFVAPSPSGRTAIIYRSDDTYSVIDVYLVTELELLNPEPV